MNTQTHLLMAAAILARPGDRRRNAAVAAGALLPDLAIYAMFLWSKIAGVAEREVWRVWYFTPPWQVAIDWAHSIPLYGGIVLLGLWRGGRSGALAAFGVAALIHIAGDLPLHTEDAHAHFLPFSDRRLISRVSYWDPSAYGGVVVVFEAAIGLLCIAVLWRRFPAVWVRGLLGLALAAYLVPTIYFGGHLHLS